MDKFKTWNQKTAPGLKMAYLPPCWSPPLSHPSAEGALSDAWTAPPAAAGSAGWTPPPGCYKAWTASAPSAGWTGHTREEKKHPFSHFWPNWENQRPKQLLLRHERRWSPPTSLRAPPWWATCSFPESWRRKGAGFNFRLLQEIPRLHIKGLFTDICLGSAEKSPFALRRSWCFSMFRTLAYSSWNTSKMAAHSILLYESVRGQVQVDLHGGR